ncbi:MAG TPA: 1-deoxy-D-xylulose-5-phosphate reductoisomerase [Candidatus Baltobacteraceae bacterium]|nr:1-deoxy-D-xylulose-5-phosphate reductoisomerase [Candidatus Baltobacteraceae bacterium]
MKKIAILGSTGSIGTQALDVIARYPDRFRVVGLAAGRNVDLLREQAQTYRPGVVASAIDGPDGLMRVALESKPDLLLAATDGAVAFDAVFAAVERGIDVAVANKELIVAAGELLMAAARRSGSAILPVDSEHSAVFQCLVGENPESVAAVVLTASGGPFWRLDLQAIADASLEAALAHPNWRMGTKNTIDSASMMNKGLEIIEASHLFGLPAAKLHIAVHPQSIAHGFVVFTDGSVKGQLCAPDMRVPIGYALAYPNRLTSIGDFEVLEALGAKPQAAELRYDFERPDLVRFPCVRLAYQALERGGVAPAVLSAANEVAVAAFVEGKIRFGAIAEVVEATLERVALREATLDGIRAADRDARIAAVELVEDRICC